MREQFSNHRTAFARRKWPNVTWGLVTLSLLGIALVSIGVGSKSQVRKEQAFTALITKSYSGDVVAFSPDGKLLATAHRTNPAFFKVWDLERGRLLQTVKTDQNGGIGLVAISPDKTTVVTSGAHDDNRFLLWDVRTGEKTGQITSSNYDPQSLIFSPDSNWIINSGFSYVEFWDVSTSQLLRVWREDNGSVFVALMPDGETLLMAGDSGIKLRNLQTGRLLRKVPFVTANTKQYLKAALSPDGKTLAMGVRFGGGQPETIELWDVGNGKLRLTLAENPGNKKGGKPAMKALSFSRDNKLLASSSNNQPVKLWNVQSGSLRATLEAKVPTPVFTPDEKTVAFSPDGTTLAVGVHNEVHLWKVDALLKGGSQ